MEKIIKAIKIGGKVNTFIGDIIDPIIKTIEFFEEQHPDKIDDIDFVFKSSGPSHSLTIGPSKSFSDQKQKLEFLTKNPQSEEYEVQVKKTL